MLCWVVLASYKNNLHIASVILKQNKIQTLSRTCYWILKLSRPYLVFEDFPGPEKLGKNQNLGLSKTCDHHVTVWTDLDDDFPLELVGSGQQSAGRWNWFFEQHVTEHVHEAICHPCLLLLWAMVLYWQDHRVPSIQHTTLQNNQNNNKDQSNLAKGGITVACLPNTSVQASCLHWPFSVAGSLSICRLHWMPQLSHLTLLNSAEQTAEHPQCLAHDQAWQETWPDLQVSTDPQHLWSSFVEFLGQDTGLLLSLTRNERDK